MAGIHDDFDGALYLVPQQKRRQRLPHPGVPVMTTAALIASILLGPSPVIVPPPQGSSAAGVAVYGSGTCIGADSAVYDNNGAQGCQKLTDVAPQGIMVRPQPAFAGGTQTAADTVICGGQDETTIAIDDYTLCGTDIVIDRNS